MDFSPYFDYSTNTKTQKKNISFLARFTEEDWKNFLQYAQIYTVNEGEQIVKYQEQDPSLFIVVKGEFAVLIPELDSDRFYKIASITEGSIFGELNFIDGEPRSASIKAMTDGQLIQLTRNAFDIMATKEKRLMEIFLFDLCFVLAQRLRNK